MKPLQAALVLLAVASLSAPCAVHAADPDQAVSSQEGRAPPGPPPRERDPKFEVALDACRQVLGVADGARPDRQKMDACLKDKGFTPPPPRPHGHGPGGQHPVPPEQDDDVP